MSEERREGWRRIGVGLALAGVVLGVFLEGMRGAGGEVIAGVVMVVMVVVVSVVSLWVGSEETCNKESGGDNL